VEGTLAAALNAYYGITITLSDTNTHNLLTLLQAVDSTLAGIQQNVGHLGLQADSANSTNAIYIGDANVASSRYGLALVGTSAPQPYTKEAANVPVGSIYVRASQSNLVLHVEIIP
jgi:hypothetical protein